MATTQSLDELAHSLAYENSLSAIECNCPSKVTVSREQVKEVWFDLTDIDFVHDEVAYLERRGLLVRHEDNASLVQILDESEDDRSTAATEIDCTPAGLLVNGGAERVRNAHSDFMNATADVANYFEQLWDESAMAGGINSDEADEAERLIKARNEAQEEFLRAIAGHPPAMNMPEVQGVL